MSLPENPSGRSRIVSKVFQLYWGKLTDAFRYLGHFIWIPSGLGINQFKNILPTKLQGPSRRKRVKNVQMDRYRQSFGLVHVKSQDYNSLFQFPYKATLSPKEFLSCQFFLSKLRVDPLGLVNFIRMFEYEIFDFC